MAASLPLTHSDHRLWNKGLLPIRTTQAQAQESGVETEYQARPRVRQPSRVKDVSPKEDLIPPDIKPPGATASQLLPPLSAKSGEEGSPPQS